MSTQQDLRRRLGWSLRAWSEREPNIDLAALRYMAWKSWPEVDAEPCESPIERLLLAAFLTQGCEIGPPDRPGRMAIQSQVQIGRCRPDLLIDWMGLRFVVECDGLAYHGTVGQVARDERRDFWLTTAGGVDAVMRYSGSDIWEDPIACAAEVLDTMEYQIERRDLWDAVEALAQKQRIEVCLMDDLEVWP